MPSKINGIFIVKYKDGNGELCEVDTFNVEMIKTYLGFAEVVISGLKRQSEISINMMYSNRDKDMILLNPEGYRPFGFKIGKNCLIKKNETTLWVGSPLKNFRELKEKDRYYWEGD